MIPDHCLTCKGNLNYVALTQTIKQKWITSRNGRLKLFNRFQAPKAKLKNREEKLRSQPLKAETRNLLTLDKWNLWVKYPSEAFGCELREKQHLQSVHSPLLLQLIFLKVRKEAAFLFLRKCKEWYWSFTGSSSSSHIKHKHKSVLCGFILLPLAYCIPKNYPIYLDTCFIVFLKYSLSILLLTGLLVMFMLCSQ